LFLIFHILLLATTVLYPLPLHDALPIWCCQNPDTGSCQTRHFCTQLFPKEFFQCQYTQAYPDRKCVKRTGISIIPLSRLQRCLVDRKSTRLNSSHVKISYAVFCLKKKNT